MIKTKVVKTSLNKLFSTSEMICSGLFLRMSFLEQKNEWYNLELSTSFPEDVSEIQS